MFTDSNTSAARRLRAHGWAGVLMGPPGRRPVLEAAAWTLLSRGTGLEQDVTDTPERMLESLKNAQMLLNLAVSFLELYPKEMITPERHRLKGVVLGIVYNIYMLVKQKCPVTGNYINFGVSIRWKSTQF